MPFKCGYGSRWKTPSFCSAQGFQISSNNHNFIFPGSLPDLSKATQNLNLTVSHVVNLTERALSPCNPLVMSAWQTSGSRFNIQLIICPLNTRHLGMASITKEFIIKYWRDSRSQATMPGSSSHTWNGQFSETEWLAKHSRVCASGLVHQFRKCCRSLDG